MFTWADVNALKEIYERAVENNKEDAFISIVCPPNSPGSNPKVYVLKVDDIVKLKNKINQNIASDTDPKFKTKLIQRNWEIQQKFKDSSDPERAFLQFFNNSGVSLYKLSNDMTSFSKLKVNSMAQSSQVTPINPCN